MELTTYKLSFLIKGSNLNFGNINKEIGFKPSKTVCMGEQVSKVIKPSEIDMWAFESNDLDEDMLYIKVEELCKQLIVKKTYIDYLVYKYDVSIKIFINSELAQTKLSIPHKILLSLGKLPIRLDISIFSWGKVTN